MWSTFHPVLRLGSLVLLGLLGLGFSVTQGQTYYVPGGGTSPWSGYYPGYPWYSYAPGAAWGAYVPGTAPSGTAPTAVTPPSPTPPGAVTRAVPPRHVTTPYRPAYSYAEQPGRLLNGVADPVPGPNPYADGRRRSYYEYGSGRNIPLMKPWLPGAPGG